MQMRPRRTSCNRSSLICIGIPTKFLDSKIEDFKTYGDADLESVKKYVSGYIDTLQQRIERNEGLFFYGSNGVGKSMLSSIILKEAYMLRYLSRRVTFSRYISEYTKSWGKNANERDEIEQELYEEYKGAEFLVLEEVGKEIDSKIAKPILEDLLRYREEHGLITVMCCNLTPEVIRKDYGESIYSILTGCMTPIKIVGDDRRHESFIREVKR